MKIWKPEKLRLVHSCLDWVVRVVSSSTYQCYPIGTAKSASCSSTWSLSGNSRPQLVCIETQAASHVLSWNHNNAVSESAWACKWLNVHVPRRLPCANYGFFKQPQANLYCTSYCCFTTARFHLNWSLLVSGHTFGLGMSFREPQANLDCMSFNDRQYIRLNRSPVVCGLWAGATYYMYSCHEVFVAEGRRSEG